MKNILTQGTDAEFQSWMEDYFKDKSSQDLRNILLSHEPGLAEYFGNNPISALAINLVFENPLKPQHLDWLLIDIPEVIATHKKNITESPEFGAFLFALLPNGKRKSTTFASKGGYPAS